MAEGHSNEFPMLTIRNILVAFHFIAIPEFRLWEDTQVQKVPGFESQHRVLNGHFSLVFVIQMECLFEETKKRPGMTHLKNLTVT